MKLLWALIGLSLAGCHPGLAKPTTEVQKVEAKNYSEKYEKGTVTHCYEVNWTEASATDLE